MEEGMMLAFTRDALRDDGAFWRHVTFFQADKANAKFICFFHPFVDMHLGENVAVFGLVHLIADEALFR